MHLINNKPPEPTEKTFILNIPFTLCSFDDILGQMEYSINQGIQGNYISITNTESAYHATKNPVHRQYIRNANFSCCDGVGIILIGKFYGYEIPRLHGPDLMSKCCQYGVKKRWRHFFYGGKPETPERLNRKLCERYPGLIVSGMYSPPFRTKVLHESNEVVDRIKTSRPDILWVGLGLLKQETWIKIHLERIHVPWMIGVGAAFDFHAGTVKRAPLFYQKIGLEWLYRLAFEPRMLIRNMYSFMLVVAALKERHRHPVKY